MAKPEKLTPLKAIHWRCHNCEYYYLDGKNDCENTKCELYSFMKYAKLKPDLSFMEFSPYQKGLTRWEDCERQMTDEQRAAAAQRMRDFHKKVL
jgi:hypothetical protein